MADIVKIKEVPEPIFHHGKPRFIGWSTPGVAQQLIAKKLGEKSETVEELAAMGCGRNSPANCRKAKGNIPALRTYLREHGEFLLTYHGHGNRLLSVKVCNFTDHNDLLVAQQILTRLIARGEITGAEADRWQEKLHLMPFIETVS